MNKGPLGTGYMPGMAYVTLKKKPALLRDYLGTIMVLFQGKVGCLEG